MLLEAILIGLWTGLAGIDQFNGLLHFHRPIVSGPVIGLILGDVQTGLVVGAALELVAAGMVPLAGAQPPNVVLAGTMGAVFAILGGVTPETAVGIAMPFAIAGQAIITLLFTVMAPLMGKMDSWAEEGNTDGISRLNWVEPVVLFITFGLIGFLPVYLGASTAEALVTWIPDWVLHGFEIAGGLMPAVGFASLLKIMYKTEYLPFFIIGFLLVAYLEIPILGIALIFAAVALYDYTMGERLEKAEAAAEANAGAGTYEEDYSDGI